MKVRKPAAWLDEILGYFPIVHPYSIAACLLFAVIYLIDDAVFTRQFEMLTLAQ